MPLRAGARNRVPAGWSPPDAARRFDVRLGSRPSPATAPDVGSCTYCEMISTNGLPVLGFLTNSRVFGCMNNSMFRPSESTALIS